MNSDARSPRAWQPLPNWFRLQAANHPGSVLLETTRFDEENFRSFLFLNPYCQLAAKAAEEVEDVFRKIDEHLAWGRYVAGFISYECGYVLEGLPANRPIDLPLIQMGTFDTRLVFDHRTGEIKGTGELVSAERLGNEIDAGTIRETILEISEEDYTERIGRVRRYLEAGHSYQVNFTDSVSGSFAGSPSALYRNLIDRQPVSYAAYIDCGSYQILSFSPELFYRATTDRVVVKPMKGTWAKGVNLEDDERAARLLRHDPKNRAEHVTIVDLLRNDLGKICAPGSVQVERLMEVERYSTLLQMTSTISGVPSVGKTPSEIFRALFPSGSITGAPKRRTMEIISELERNARGVYTGAIGWFSPDGGACFNVAIRTVVTKANHLRLGVGGGITLDSNSTEEYKECQLKASFLYKAKMDFHLIETMRAECSAVPLLERHIKRLRESSEYFRIDFDEQNLRRMIAQVLHEYPGWAVRVRLTLERDGQAAMRCSELIPVPWTGRILLSPSQTDPTDIFLYHKTSARNLYDVEFSEAQRNSFDEVLFRNREGSVTEGAISNIFLRIGESIVTPSMRCGLLPGVRRTHILATVPNARTATITMSDLRSAQQIWLCNALRGVRPVARISDYQGNLFWQACPSADVAMT